MGLCGKCHGGRRTAIESFLKHPIIERGRLLPCLSGRSTYASESILDAGSPSPFRRSFHKRDIDRKTCPGTQGKADLPGARRGKEAGALDAAGAVLGSFGLVAFGLVIWLMIVRCPVWDTFSLRFRDSPSRRSDGSHGDGVVTPARDL
jgi:hypothetical protein